MAPVIAGCWQLAEGHRLTPMRLGSPSPIERLERCVERGLYTFDCADIYTGVEDLLGELRRRLPAADAAKLRIHTKYVPDLESLGSLTRADVRRSIDRSLQRLGVERIDLVQFHWWDLEVPGWVGVAGWLGELVDEGKVGRLGVTNFDTPQLRTLLDAGIPVRSHQTQYSLLDRRPERELVALCAEHHVDLLAYGTLAGGLLSERFRGAAPPEGDENRSQMKYRLMVEERGGWEWLQQLLETLHAVARRHGVTLSDVASAWVLGRQQVAAVIVGVGARSQPDPGAITAVELTSQDHAALERVLGAAPEIPGGVYELERDRDGRHGRIMKYDLHED
ncbi:MAG: aldo/keto reductase [Acidobacteria bacterium]|nr:MAG: aldo/keto reductase [Acidobacteriota bacterium]REK00339.1 MAG: aldo/keto reductase [Acidobacteriota bacterium]